jgi:hypothetical protein
MVPVPLSQTIMVMVPARQCVVHKADIPKCHISAIASQVRFHSRNNRLKGDRSDPDSNAESLPHWRT